MTRTPKILPIAGHYVAIVRTEQNEAKAVKLNKTAAEILRKLLEGIDTESVAKWLSETYQIPLAQARKDVHAVAEKWSPICTGRVDD